MAVLTDNQRLNIWEKWMRENLGDVSITKTDLRAAINAIDDFLDNNAVTINNAFSEPAKSSLSAGQKAMVLAYVAIKRWTD